MVLASVSYALQAGSDLNVLRTNDVASANAMNLIGNELVQTIEGNAGINTIASAGGNDTLTGGAGNDFFLFHAALNAATNVDTITDFSVPNDTIRLENLIFTALAAGALAAGAFRIGAAAADADDRVVYNAANGNLMYDADGTGASTSVLFAKLSAGLAMTAADFVVV
jgi:Ca2+-binding RTX toxin-like protein